jgi:hypothetical protein
MPDHWAAFLREGGPSFVRRDALEGAAVLYLLVKAAVSGVIVAAVSEIARRYPGWGGLVASLPRSGVGFWAAMAVSVAGTLALYALMFWVAPKLGVKL